MDRNSQKKEMGYGGGRASLNPGTVEAIGPREREVGTYSKKWPPPEAIGSPEKKENSVEESFNVFKT